jgi:hypothetical protein
MLGKFGAVTLGYACLLATAAAATPRQEEWIKVFISPECKEWIYGPPLTQEDAQKHPQDRPDYVLWNPAMAKPMAYRDSRTSISFYVESDGRHIAAINTKGTLLLVRNPFEDEKHLAKWAAEYHIYEGNRSFESYDRRRPWTRSEP